MSLLLRLIAMLAAIIATSAHAGGPLSVCTDAARTPIKYPGAGNVILNYDLGNLGNRTKAQTDAIVINAVALWTNVPTASVTISRGADLPVDVTSANYTTYLGNGTFGDMLNPVVYDTDGSVIDALLGVGQKNSILGFAGSASSNTCVNTEGQAVISGFLSITDTTLAITIAHEIGHLIGMDHTQLNGTQGIGAAGNYPLMYPIAARNTMTLHEDDAAAVSALYPDPTLNVVYGQISGTFVLADGVTAVRGANLWATETTTNKVYSIVSDYRQQNTGFFRLLLPAGAYNLRAGTILTNFVGGSSVGPYSDFSTDPSFQPPLYVGGNPMPTVTLGNATPTSFNINAGCAATLTFRINGTGTVGGNCAAPGSFVLNVVSAGTGTGTVTSAPAGINCGATCSTSFATGSSVTLTASPTGGSVFFGWSGACTGTGTCTVTMNSVQSVTATFFPPGAGSEIFPPGCQLPAGWIVPGTANSGWSVVSNESNQGVCSLKSNTISDNQKAQIQFTGTFNAGNITFDRRVSSEFNFDCFRFLIDGVQQAVGGTCSGSNVGGIGASGIVPWGAVSVPVAAGVHTLLWSYEKDVSFFDGEDAAFIDSVVLPVGNPGTLQFTAGTLAVSEAVGNAVVSVSRSGGSAGAASVNFVTSGVTATAGTDFTAQAGTLNWANGDAANKTITVPIVNDTLIEGNETFTITISSPTGATLGAQSTITVTIIDDDFATAPTAPTIGTATAGNAQAMITFTVPASDGGSPITGYTATCNPGTLTATALASPVNINLNNGTLYTCSVSASNAIGTSPASGTVTVTPSAAVVPTLIAVASRKTHGATGAFDVVIDTAPAITGLVTVEPRTIGSGHTILFQFNNTITAAGAITVVDGTGASVGASAFAPGNDATVTVTIPSLADNKRATLTLTGVNGNVNPSPVSMGFLVGDVNNTRSVNSSDISGVKARSGQTTNSANFKFDVNASGAVNSSDISAVKARSGLVLP